MTETKFPYSIFEGLDLAQNSTVFELDKNTELDEIILSHNKFSLILDGLIILYWIDKKGNKIIIDFKRNGDILRPAIDIAFKQEGKIYAKALNQTKLISLNREFVCKNTFTSDDISDFYYSLLTKDISSTYQQLQLLKEANIEKRYENFLNEYRDIYNLISDRMIASFLGVHYTTLARMKPRLLKGTSNTK